MVLQISCADRFRTNKNGTGLLAGKKQRWSREYQQRGGTTEMFHLLSFSGKWDPSFFATEELGDTSQDQKKTTRDAVEATAQLQLAKKYEHLRHTKKIEPYQDRLVTRLLDGSLAAEANRFTLLSGRGTINTNSGSINIGDSTGGFMRAVLYNWTPPNFDD